MRAAGSSPHKRSTLSIAIVEDDDRDRERLRTMLRTYETDNELTIRLSEFEDGAAIIEGYQPQYDIIFLDIQMAGIDGMRAAAEIRKVDTSVILIFVTKTAQYAVNGYAVQALSYLLKPVSMFAVTSEMDRSIAQLGLGRADLDPRRTALGAAPRRHQRHRLHREQSSPDLGAHGERSADVQRDASGIRRPALAAQLLPLALELPGQPEARRAGRRRRLRDVER